MKLRTPLAIVAVTAVLLAWSVPSAFAGYQGKPMVHQTAHGKILTDPEGTPLYTYEYDTSGVPTCINTCNNTWPPERAAQNATVSGDFGIVQRHDGIRQWTYNGMPLYGFTYDMKGGKAMGNRIAGFHLATVD